VVGNYRRAGPENITFADLVQAVIEDYADNDRKSIAHVKRRLRLHILPVLGEVRTAGFGTDQLRKFIRGRRDAGAQNATINRELAIINRAFKLAYESDTPRVLRKPKITKLRENNVREGFLEHDEYIRLRNALPEELRMLLVIAYYTGVRRGELITIQWKQVDLKAARICLAVGTTKNDEGRYLPIYGEMAEWLKMAKAIRDERFPDCPWVFHRKGERVRDFRKAWKLARIEAKVPEILLHDMRRTAVRNMTRAGIPREIARRISGHKTDSIFSLYNIVRDRDLDLAAERMTTYIGEISAKKPVSRTSRRVH
jgi:integrase